MMLERCPWYIAGPIIGALRATLNKPFGALGGYSELLDRFTMPRQWRVAAFVVIGTIVGGGLTAVIAGSWTPSFAYATGIGLLSPESPGQFARTPATTAPACL